MNSQFATAMSRALEQTRAGNPAEIAEMALFLAGPGARYITGAEIVIDGGLSLLVGVGA